MLHFTLIERALKRCAMPVSVVATILSAVEIIIVCQQVECAFAFRVNYARQTFC